MMSNRRKMKLQLKGDCQSLNMKNIFRPALFIISVILVFTTNSSKAQQLPQYTQYIFNYYGINPAAGGTSPCLDIKAGHRRQWMGFEGAPVTSFFSVNGQLPNKSKPYLKSKHVFGGYFENDQTFPTSRTNFFLNYSYHVPLSNEIYASAGIFAGLNQYSFQADATTPRVANDPAINANRKVILVPDINPGVMVYGPSFFVGYSMKNAVGNRLDNVYGFASRMQRHHFTTAGLRIVGARKEFSYMPSVNLKMVSGTPIGLDLTFLINYDNVFLWGLMYRKRDAAAALAQVRIKKFAVGYAFDFNTSRLRIANANTHEIILSYRLCFKGAGGFEEGIRCWAYQ
jgi:type IX secretion system PorP/SprF family membrane protein